MKYKKIYVEITNVCNLSCRFCPVTKRNPEFLSVDKFKIILDQIKDYTDYIYLHVKGEPLLHPDLGQFIDLAYEKGFKVNITTNGTLIKDKKDTLLGKQGLRQVNISLHSLEGNPLYKNQNQYLDSIIEFIEDAKATSPFIIALRLWNLSSDNHLIQDKNRYILGKLEKALNFNYNASDLSIKRGIKIREGLYLNEDIEFIWPDLSNDDFGDRGFCQGLRDQIGILVDGSVIPCCLDGEGKINLGNIYKESIKNILENERSKNIYDNFSRRIIVEELCRKCGYRRRFNSPNK